MDHCSDPAGTESCNMQIRHNSRKMQVRMADQAMYHQGNQSVFVGGRLWTLLPPPALFEKGRREKKKEGSFTSIQMLHTHTRQSRKNPERQEEEKSGHDGQTAKKQRRGEGNKRTSGTNLHGETDLTKTAHTPKPHDTLINCFGCLVCHQLVPHLVPNFPRVPLRKNRTQFLTTWRSCVIPLPGPWSSLPRFSKTAFKFQRIRCTIWFTSPDNHKKQRGPHLKVVCLPVTFHMVMFHYQSWSCDRKKDISGCSACVCEECNSQRISRDCRSSGTSVKNGTKPQGQLLHFT